MRRGDHVDLMAKDEVVATMSTQTITSQVTPFVSDTEVRCYFGTDYTQVLGNALHLTCSTWTNLASGTVNVRTADDSVVTTATIVTSGETGTEQEIYFELTQATLEILGRGRHNLRLVCTQASGNEYMMHDFWLLIK